MPPLKPTRGILLNKSHPLARGVVGCWLMSESTAAKVADLSGNKNDGTLQGDAHFVGGKFGSALDFDGTGDYVSIPHHTSYKQANVTVSIWFKPDATQDSWATVISLPYRTTGFSDPYVCYYIARNASNGYSSFAVTVGATDYSASDTNGTEWSDGKWCLATLTYDSETLRGYINGVLVATNTGPSGAIDYTGGDTNLAIGRASEYWADQFFTGQVDHAMIWNRALSAAEVAWLYREPFCMFERAIRPELISSPIVNLAGASTVLSSLSAKAKAIRKVGGTVTSRSVIAALLNSIRGEEASLEKGVG